jgi:hypothetical protein
VSLIVATTSFHYKSTGFIRGATYDTTAANGDISAANTAVPHLFCAAGGTKTANTSFVYHDTRAGGFDRIIGRGMVMPSGDQAVTTAPLAFN